jgi:hypothetical protein
MRIAIVDPRIQAPGLIKLFPEADYFVIKHRGRYDLHKHPDRFYSLYGFRYREDLETVTGANYDALFIVYACLDFRDKSRADVQHHLEKLLEIVNRSAFKQIVGFSNDDSPFDPAAECNYLKANIWFKRNFQTTTSYLPNVFPFPFIMFGPVCPLWRVLTESYSNPEKIDRVLWAGNVLPSHRPTRHKDYMSRHDLMNSPMQNNITTVNLSNRAYLDELSRSKFSLDMNGEGDPNYRTFELLMTDALIIQQFKYLVWPFDDGDAFCEETIYRTPAQFVEKLERLRANPGLYDHCLRMQKHIKEKYFTQEWLSSYVMRHIGVESSCEVSEKPRASHIPASGADSESSQHRGSDNASAGETPAIEFRFLELKHYNNEPHFRKFSKVLEARKRECTLLLPKGIPSQDLFDSFLNHVIRSIDRRVYLPIARFCDGEYGFYSGKEVTTCWGERRSSLSKEGVVPLHVNALRVIHTNGVLCPNLNLAYLDMQSAFLEFLNKMGMPLQNYVPFYFVYALLVNPAFLSRLRSCRVALITNFKNKNSTAILKKLDAMRIRNVGCYEIPSSGVAHGDFDFTLEGRTDVALVGAGIGSPLVLARLQKQSCLAIDSGFVFHLWDGTYDRYERLFLNYEE